MRKELVDYVGTLLFGQPGAAGTEQQLHLHSEKQFRVNSDGRLEQEQSVLTNIIVDNNAIRLHYLLPDGKEVSFVNAVRQVDCMMNSDYTIRSIVYETEQQLLFTLQCEEDGVKFYEDNTAVAGKDNKVLFEIC